MTDQRRIVQWLVESLAALLDLPPEQVPTDVPFTALGLSSIETVELSERLQRWAGVELSPTVAYDYPAVDDIAAHIAALGADRPAASAAAAPVGTAGPVPVAVVGIGCRLPGADGPEEFWRLLTGGVDAVREVPADRWDAEALYDPDITVPGRMNTKWGGFLDGIEGFDAEFHGISSREAERMDPQQRLALDTAWEALEDAGIPAGRLAGSRTGVFMGVSTFDHGTALWSSFEGIQPYDGTGGALSIIANRISYGLNLQGPSLVVDTACSSSLVAVHLACQALRAGEADLALAGGVNVITSPRIALSFSRSGLMAADGRCKPFDHRADGYVRSEGAGIVVLKPLPRALADGDRIYAVIRGGAVNQDGRTNGLTAPNGPSQRAVLRDAYRAAALPVADIGYVEAHGTGTAVGDPIEVAALAAVLGDGRPAGRPLRIGSVKSNVGHLEAAAGITGLIKTALAVHHRQLPPTVHYEKPNPMLGLDSVPVAVVADNEPWPALADGRPAPAGVSSFGFGGTNAHLVLTAAPPAPAADPDPGPRAADEAAPLLVPVSARSAEALRRRAAAWSAEARAHADDPHWAARAAAAAALRTDHGPHRAAVVAADADRLADGLAAVAAAAAPAAGVAGPRPVARQEPKVALVFPGQGAQWPGMGRRLAAAVPAFRDAIREADAAIARHLGRSLWSDADGLVVSGTAEVQPALFATQVALAATLRSWGTAPAGVIGHSMGEIAAAHVAGALSLADAAQLVCERSRLLTEISGQGGLALVELGADDAARLVAGREHELSVAALNGPRATVLSGTVPALEDVLAQLAGRGVFARRIAVEFAAHSPQVEPLQPRLRRALDGLRPGPADVELYSTVTGGPVDGRDLGPEYWVTNVRAPVRFGPALGRLLADGYTAFVEITPHPVLARPVLDHLEDAGRTDALVVSALRRDQDEPAALLGALGALYTAGCPVDWQALHPGTPVHTPLPRHGWQRRPFPIARPAAHRPGRRTPGGGLLGERIPVGVEPGLRLWDLPIGLDTAPELADHLVEDVPLVAGAYWLTAAARAAAATAGTTRAVLRDVAFAQPCPLGDGEDGSPVLQLSVRPGPDGRQHFAVTSCPPAGGPVTHATGTLGAPGDTEPPTAPGTPEDLARRCPEEQPVDTLYERLAAAGLRYGPRFRAVERLTVGDGEALALVRLPAGLAAGEPPLHPALLDACLHTVAAAGAGAAPDGALPLPVGADLVRADQGGTAVREAWCHAAIRHADGRDVTADVTVLAPDGTPVWSATGFRLRLAAPRRPEDGRVHETRWQPYPPGPAADPGRWLLLADDASRPLALALAARLERDGARTRVAPADPGTAAVLAAVDAEGPLRGVVDTRAAAPGGGEPTAELHTRTAAALHLAQQLTGRAWSTGAPPRLWLLTAGTQPPNARPEDGAPTGATLWGLGRAVHNEHPDSGCSLLDLPSAAGPADLDAAATALLAAEPPVQAAVHAGALLAPVLADAARTGAAGGTGPLRPDRTYVVTGGLGALGLRVARRLADRGARHLLLLGRGAPSEQARQRIAELAADGCLARTAAVDVADREALRAALPGPAGADGRPPVGGVVHLAGVLDDALLADVTGPALARVLAGKAAGAWHLHELTRDHPVDTFVLFSSLAGLIGSPGQGAYAAANTFLDALAAHRAALGLPGRSIAWGTWAGDTLAATGGGTDRLAARGVPPLDPDTAIRLMDEAVGGRHPQTAVFALVPDRLAAAGVWPAARDLLAALLPQGGDGDGHRGAAPAVREELLAAGTPAQRHRVLAEHLTEQVRQVLRARPGQVAADVPFQNLGFDSLMAIELRGRLETALGLRLSATLVYAYPTVEALTEQLLTRLEPPAEAPAQPAAPPAPEAPATTPAELAGLDDAQVAALLAAELDAFEAEGEI
ncbi:SDR family NAD(P)-dependent oxidoreductase [Kitasatospora sp. NPDC059646]|uniref:SDR family NAD(P)-dependent oxidoreductase n=1 Tax=Kitasatospora sp. NPDC059646 TaxID=3346893 RepID=UPI0036C61E9B